MGGPDASPGDLRVLAAELARTAGTAALAGRRSLGIGQATGQLPAHATKSSVTDPVTEFDQAAEVLIVSALRARRPDDAIVGEEGTADDGTSGIAWHIDPIDGTSNFLYDQPGWCTSVAAVDADGSVAGAVYVPVVDELFTAARGEGATLDGVPLSVSGVTRLDLALVGTGFSYLPERRAAQAARVAALLPQLRDIRRIGSSALDLCYVAAGRIDAYFEEYLNSWDIAAGLLIAAEAGATTSALDGTAAHEGAVLAAAPGVHTLLLDAIRAAAD